MTLNEAYHKWIGQIEVKTNNIDKLRECFKDLWFAVREHVENDEGIERCEHCGHTAATGACFYCKMD